MIIRAYVEADWQRSSRMDSRTRNVERKFTDTDRHTTRALVSNPENRFVVGHNHQLHVCEWCCVPQYLLDATGVIRRNPDAPCAAKYPAEILRRFANRRCIDNRHQFFEVLAQYLVKQVLVTILQCSQVDMATDRVLIKHDCFVDASRLGFNIVILRRKQAIEIESFSFRRRETRAFVVKRKAKQCSAAHWHVQLITVLGSSEIEFFQFYSGTS